MITFAMALIILAAAVIAIEVIMEFNDPGVLTKDYACGPDYCTRIRGRMGYWIAIPILFLLPVPSLLARALRLGPKAYFEVRQRGLVWGSAWRARGRPWDQVYALDVQRTVQRTNWLLHLLGQDYRCTIVFTNRTQLTFRSNTIGYATLESRVRRYCPAVVRLPLEEQRWRRFRFAWLAIALTSLTAGVAGLLYVDDRITRPRINGAPAFSDSQVVLLVCGYGVAFAGFISGLTAYLMAAPLRPR